nr:lysylphosphatidylglycerol synthase transmembrane domain-containing protein [uncultured Methanolobus sp.]
MKKTEISALVFSKKTIVSFLISFLILYILVKNVDAESVLNVSRTASLPLLITAFIVHYLSFLVRGTRWKTLLNIIGISSNTLKLTKMVFLSWFVNSIVPAKLGDIYRSYLLKKSTETPISASLGTIFVERIFDIAVLLLLLTSSGLLIFKNNIPQQISEAMGIGYLLLIIICIGLICSWLFRDRIFELIPEKIHFHTRNLHNGVYISLSSKSTVFKTILLTLVIWTLEASRFMLVTKSLGLHLGFELIIFVVLAASLLTAIPLTPAGLGAVEVSIVFLLGIFGVGTATGTSVALLDRLISYWSILVTGTAVYIFDKED